MSGCAYGGDLTVRVDNSIISAMSDRCRSVADGATGDLEGVFDVEWDSVTFARPGAIYRDLADASRATFDASLESRLVPEPTLVLTNGGAGVSAIETDGLPVALETPTTLLQTVEYPGSFTRRGNACSFDA